MRRYACTSAVHRRLAHFLNSLKTQRILNLAQNLLYWGQRSKQPYRNQEQHNESTITRNPPAVVGEHRARRRISEPRVRQ
jgi:hypothetical protein